MRSNVAVPQPLTRVGQALSNHQLFKSVQLKTGVPSAATSFICGIDADLVESDATFAEGGSNHDLDLQAYEVVNDVHPEVAEEPSRAVDDFPAGAIKVEIGLRDPSFLLVPAAGSQESNGRVIPLRVKFPVIFVLSMPALASSMSSMAVSAMLASGNRSVSKSRRS